MHKHLLNEYLNTVLLEPAYGRKYKTEQEAISDWQAGKDFKFVGGPYCSIRERDMISKTMRNPLVYIEISNGTLVKV